VSRLSNWLLVAAACLASAAACADTEARIAAVDPANGSMLTANESVYVRIEYSTSEPVKLWARPFYRGREVTQARSNASESYTGSGEALGWFSLLESGEVDEVRVRAGGGTPYREWEVASLPVALHWDVSRKSSGRAEAVWVSPLKADAAARMAARAKQAASEPVSGSELALFNGFMLAMAAIGLAGIVVPLWSVWKWRGGWRVAAAVPAALVILVVLRIVIGVALDPTSHNLWPFEILMFSALALVIVGVLKIARRFMGAQS
jgi:hypothetical protein